ncbi:unnamed protein product, partial [Lymnaea stagnalis]
MRTLVSVAGREKAQEGKCIFFFKRYDSSFDDKNIAEAVVCGSLHISEGTSLLGSISEQISKIYYPALTRLKLFTSYKRWDSVTKCHYNEMFCSIENFIRHLSWGNIHTLGAVGLGTLPDHGKMAL